MMPETILGSKKIGVAGNGFKKGESHGVWGGEKGSMERGKRRGL